jgi:hypothetical protein
MTHDTYLTHLRCHRPPVEHLDEKIVALVVLLCGDIWTALVN